MFATYGGLNFRDLVHFLRVFTPGAEFEAKAKYAFKVFDIDNDNKIGKYDLKYTLKLMTGDYLENEKLDEIVNLMLKENDKKGKGYLDLESFKATFSKEELIN